MQDISFTDLAIALRALPGALDLFVEAEGVRERYPLETALAWFSKLGLS